MPSASARIRTNSQCTTTCRRYLKVMRAPVFAIRAAVFGCVGLPIIVAATSRGFNSDAELQQALVGTWEIRVPLKEMFPITKAFVTYRGDGRFDQSSIAEFGNNRSRMDIQGQWRTENGALVETLTNAKDSDLVGTAQRHPVVSVTANQIALRGKRYSIELRRTERPKQLPPVSGLLSELMQLGRMKKAYALETPEPSYPYQARKNSMEGRGIYRLRLNPAGTVKSVEPVISSRDRDLDTAAIKGLQRWRFQPGKVKTLLVPVTFVMAY